MRGVPIARAAARSVARAGIRKGGFGTTCERQIGHATAFFRYCPCENEITIYVKSYT